MEYLRKLHMICFRPDELEKLYADAKSAEIFSEMLKRNYTIDTVKKDKQKMEEITDIIVEKGLKNSDEVEVFIALESCLIFYPENSKICFVLKSSFDPRKNPIKTLDNLKKAAEKRTLTDFAIVFDEKLLQFQLKQFKGKITTEKVFDFIKNKLGEYGNVLGDVNLLIILQGDETGIAETSFWNDLYKKVSALDLKFGGQILLAYNEENKFQVINQVYPLLTTCRKAITDEYLEGNFSSLA